jgi:hypothetical protein
MPLTGPNIGQVMVKFARTVEGASVETVKRSSAVAEHEQLRRMRSDSGGDLKLSGVNKAKGRPGNTKIGVKTKVTRQGSGAVATVSATGPLQIINNPTRGRVIRSAYGAGTRGGRGGRGTRGFVGPVLAGQFGGGRRAVLNIPGIGYRRSARHPGTRGKNTWQEGRKAAEPKIRRVMSTRTTTVISKAMKG